MFLLKKSRQRYNGGCSICFSSLVKPIPSINGWRKI
jgi:hypothetical protein